MKPVIKNGILYIDGKAQFCLGQSYYPSYHWQKVPVPADGDRLGEMRKDLKAMREAGFNLCRIAAIGDLGYEDGKVTMNFPLPDAFCRMCDENDIAAMVRLQGYSINLRGWENDTMIDSNGVDMGNHWGWFVRSCLNHKGLLEDNVMATKASAAHFARFPAVCSYQIYNEPAYPSIGLYDYHPMTQQAYAQWRKEQGLEPKEVPFKRDANDPEGWAQWRQFLRLRLNDFLVESAAAAKEGAPDVQTLTCHMGCPVKPGATVRAEDYYITAEGMDISGITQYSVFLGPAFHVGALQLDAIESAGAVFGKRPWLIEYNARTDMPPQEWYRETYAAVARGIKGILYYQWRADLPYPDGPEPEQFGMLYSTGEKAPNYAAGVRMNQVINRLSEELALAEKVRCGVALLYSDHANAVSDALENTNAMNVEDCKESSILGLQHAYKQLNSADVVVDVVRPVDLSANVLNTRVLIIPFRKGLTEEELDMVDAFAAKGGSVYEYRYDTMAFVPYQREVKKLRHGDVYVNYDVNDLLDKEEIDIPVSLLNTNSCAEARLLKGDKADWVVITNYDPMERPIEDASIYLPGAKSARAYAESLPDEGVKCEVEDGFIDLPTLPWGAFVRVEK